MSRLLSLVIVTTSALLVLPGATAFEITISGLEGLPSLAAGETHDHPFQVTMGSTDNQNIVCAQDGSLTVTLTPTGVDDALGLGATVDPESLSFTIATNAYLGAGGTPWDGGSKDATLRLTIGEALPATTESHTFGVKAEYDGTAPETCQGDFRPASDEAEAEVPLVPATGAPGTGGPTNGTDPEETPDDDQEESPAPGGLFVVLAVGLVALLRRR